MAGGTQTDTDGHGPTRTETGPTDAERFLGALMAPYAAMGDAWGLPTVEVRCLAPASRGGGAPQRRWFGLGRLREAAEHCLEMAEEWDVYAGVLPRRGRGGRLGSIPWAGWLFADIDGGSDGPLGAIGLVSRKPARWSAPEMMVISGGGCHCYWRLSAPAEMDDEEQRQLWRSAERGLVEAIGGAEPGAHADLNATDIARILRVPGTWNHKRGKPVQLIRLQPGEHDLALWVGAVGAPIRRPLERSAAPPQWQHDQMLTDGLMRWAAQGYQEGSRHGRIVADARWLLRDKGMPQNVAETLLRAKVAASPGRHPIGEEELRQMMRWAHG